jgi:hypothetical protein
MGDESCSQQGYDKPEEGLVEKQQYQARDTEPTGSFGYDECDDGERYDVDHGEHIYSLV